MSKTFAPSTVWNRNKFDKQINWPTLNTHIAIYKYRQNGTVSIMYYVTSQRKSVITLVRYITVARSAGTCLIWMWHAANHFKDRYIAVAVTEPGYDKGCKGNILKEIM